MTPLPPPRYDEPRGPFTNLPKQMYRATNGHPAAIADVIFMAFHDFPVFSNRVFVLKPTHNL